MVKIKKYALNGLTCASCASKIEEEVRRLPEVDDVNLNLMTNEISISTIEGKVEETAKSLIKIVKRLEPSVVVSDLDQVKQSEDEHGHHHGFELNKKSYALRMLVALLLTAASAFLDVNKEIKFAFILLGYILVGAEVLIQAGKNILRGQIFDENFLMGIASLGAFIIGERVEAVAVLVFYGVGEILQDMAVEKSKKDITALMDIRPDYANLKDGNSERIVSPEEVKVGDVIIVKPGEKIPLDGVITEGKSFIDSKALTGESVPVEVTKEEEVLSGCINMNGVLEIKVSKTFGESTVSKILELVQNASSKKAESEKFITKFARYYTPIVVIIALLVAIVPTLLGIGTASDWVYKALSFLIISCPCALVISIPLSFFGGIGGSARHGILVKGGNYLDAINDLDTIVFDKTGTLTKGVFEIQEIVPAKGVSADELIHLAASVENQSTHPIAKSIMKYYGENNKELFIMKQITEKAGHGIIANYEDDIIYSGNARLMEINNIRPTKVNKAGTIVHIAKNKDYLGYILVADEIRDQVSSTIKELKSLGIKKTIMLTGDQKEKADEIGNKVGIDKIYSELLPQDKVKIFERLRDEKTSNKKIAFVGDGINDAPVLAIADVGIAMGGIGSDAAIESADVVIMNDNFENISRAVKISRKTRRIVTENIVIALGVKIGIMILALWGITSIWFAIFADVGVALIALLNATRAMKLIK